MDNKIIGHVNALETFGLVDGPGVRFVVFMQGCKMRCKYCHNPETWNLSGGEEWTAENLYNRAKIQLWIRRDSLFVKTGILKS